MLRAGQFQPWGWGTVGWLPGLVGGLTLRKSVLRPALGPEEREASGLT